MNVDTYLFTCLHVYSYGLNLTRLPASTPTQSQSAGPLRFRDFEIRASRAALHRKTRLRPKRAVNLHRHDPHSAGRLEPAVCTFGLFDEGRPIVRQPRRSIDQRAQARFRRPCREMGMNGLHVRDGLPNCVRVRVTIEARRRLRRRAWRPATRPMSSVFMNVTKP